MWRSFWCAAVAAITLKSLNPFGNHSLVLVSVMRFPQTARVDTAVRGDLHQKLPLLGIRDLYPPRRLWGERLGLATPGKADVQGVYGAVFSRLNILWAKTIRQGTWVRHHPIIEVILVSAACGPFASIFSPHR
jgi:chloride channel 3/4/5